MPIAEYIQISLWPEPIAEYIQMLSIPESERQPAASTEEVASLLDVCIEEHELRIPRTCEPGSIKS